MDATEIFLLIASIGLVVLWIFIATIIFYVLRALYLFSKILEKVEKNIDSIGDVTKELLIDMQGSSVYKFLFKKKRSKIQEE